MNCDVNFVTLPKILYINTKTQRNSFSNNNNKTTTESQAREILSDEICLMRTWYHKHKCHHVKVQKKLEQKGSLRRRRKKKINFHLEKESTLKTSKRWKDSVL
jgi:hypothetical protein